MSVSLCRQVWLFCFVFILPVSSFGFPGEEIPKGRDANGRAYRTDEHGFQIVDHVAELEVTVDDLKRQMRILEDELREKDSRLRYATPAPQPQLPQPGFAEVDIVTSTRSDDSFNHATANHAKARNVEIGLLEERNAELEQRYQNRIKVLQERIALQNVELEKAVSGKRVETATLKKSLSKLEASFSDIEKKAETKTEIVERLEEQLAEKSAKEKELSTQIASLNYKLDEVTRITKEMERARLAAARPVKHAKVETPVKRKRRPQTVASRVVRKNLKKQIVTVQRLISKRKGLADSIRSSGGRVSVTMSALRTSSGDSLDVLRKQASRIDSLEEGKHVSSGLREIKRVLNSDILVMKRISKL